LIVAGVLLIPFVVAAIVVVQSHRAPRPPAEDPPVLAPSPEDLLLDRKGHAFADLVEAKHELARRCNDPAMSREQREEAGAEFMDRMAVAKEFGVIP
jgi:hypothetical protein